MADNKNHRMEKDPLGSIKVPKEAYFGIATMRAQKNFQISGISAPKTFKKAIGIVKLAAAQTNISLGLIDKKYAGALIKACEEFMQSKFSKEFVLDVFQAGAGTSYNMNANEIIANRANELLGGKKGKYTFLHPNNEVNMAQSTNDVIPSALRIAILLILPALLKELDLLIKAIGKRAKETANIIKVGRTHLQDAVPISLSQEFNSYKEALEKSKSFIEERKKDLEILGIGGTAVGTGINSNPGYQKLAIANISKITKIPFKAAKNLTEMTNNMNSFLNFSAAIRSLAINLINLCANLKLMNSGPKSGFKEINLPAVQPGSSIMPGKINPSVVECLEMICLQVLGNDKVIELSAERGQFELNTTCPLIMHNLLQSIEILTSGLKIMRELAIEKMKINKETIQETFEKSLCTATALSPVLGYQKTAEVVQSALKNGINIKKEVLRQKILKEKEINEILSMKNLVRPSKNGKKV